MFDALFVETGVTVVLNDHTVSQISVEPQSIYLDFELNPDGRAYQNIQLGAGAPDRTAFGGEWQETPGAEPGSAFDVLATVLEGDIPDGSAVGVRLSLGSVRKWSHYASEVEPPGPLEKYTKLLVKIFRVGASEPLDQAEIILHAILENES